MIATPGAFSLTKFLFLEFRFVAYRCRRDLVISLKLTCCRHLYFSFAFTSSRRSPPNIVRTGELSSSPS
jgi:hypothetical protein